jgi:DNA-binding transcriptional regulator YiaG
MVRCIGESVVSSQDERGDDMIEALDALLSSVQKTDLPPPADRARIRKAAGVSQEAFGKVLGVTRLTISMWEQGKTEPSGKNRQEYIRALQHIADRFGLPWKEGEGGDE